MAASRSKNHPRGPQKASRLISMRITSQQEARLNAMRGELALTTYIGIVLDDHLHSPVERAIRDCQAHNAQRGVTHEMLAAAEASKAK